VLDFSVESSIGVWTGVLTVKGDDMEGSITWVSGVSHGLLLRRISPASAPTSN
jgi:hypothetical protein